MKRAFKLVTTVCLSLCLIFSFGGQANALNTADVGIEFAKNKSFNKDGKLYLSFTISGARESPVAISAEVLNPSGKRVLKWKETEVGVLNKVTRNFGADYGNLPSGTYAFILTMRTTWTNHTFQWKGNINNKSTKYSALSFKSCEKVLDSNGRERHKFTINSIGGKGRTVAIRIFDSDGNMVTLIPSKELKSDNTDIWFKWNGYSDIGSGYKCSSGKYVVQAYFQGEEKVIEKEYNLRIY